MEAFLFDWLNLLIRWGHLIAGIGWIGTSFYFVALDMSLIKRAGQDDTIVGSLWEVHGGGFYYVEKYQRAPAQLPSNLIWYKWEAYLTWFTGICLMAVQYYVNADVYLIDQQKIALKQWEAIALSLASFGCGWLVYHGLCRSVIGKHHVLLSACVFVLLVGMGWFYSQVFASRGALLHIGAYMGTLMAFNVFGVIIPNQKKIVAALVEGKTPDPNLGLIGKQRSLHNTWLVLPVILLMVSSHYPMLIGVEQLWLLVGLILIAGACLRHALISHEIGKSFKDYVWSVLAFFGAITFAFILTMPDIKFKEHVSVDASEVMLVINKHCSSCHSKTPRHEDFEEPPASIALDSIEEVHDHVHKILQVAVYSTYMPLEDSYHMQDSERDLLGSYLSTRE